MFTDLPCSSLAFVIVAEAILGARFVSCRGAIDIIPSNVAVRKNGPAKSVRLSTLDDICCVWNDPLISVHEV